MIRQGHFRFYDGNINSKQRIRNSIPIEWEINLCGYILQSIVKAGSKGATNTTISIDIAEARLWISKNLAQGLMLINEVGHFVITKKVGGINRYFATDEIPRNEKGNKSINRARQAILKYKFPKTCIWDGFGREATRKANDVKRPQRPAYTPKHRPSY